MTKKRRNVFFAFAALFAAAGFMLLMLALSLSPALPEQSSAPAEPSPDFAFTTLAGKTHRISDFKGRPVALHFWASWCRPCEVEFPPLIKAAKGHPEVAVIAVSADAQREDITKFMQRFEPPANFYTVHDKDKKIIYDLFQTVNYPETILIGCDFTMQGKIIGMAQDWDGVMQEMLSGCDSQTSDAPPPALPRAAN